MEGFFIHNYIFYIKKILIIFFFCIQKNYLTSSKASRIDTLIFYLFIDRYSFLVYLINGYINVLINN